MAIYKPYPKYKNSNIPWLGEIPEHWEITKLKYLITLQKGKVPKEFSNKENNLPYLSMEYLRGKLTIPSYVLPQENLIEVENDELLILWDGANAGEVMKSKKGVLSSTMAVIRINENYFDERFFFHFLKWLEKELKTFANGTTIPHLDSSVLIDNHYCIPLFEEQTAIARFLDYKLAKINRFIQKKKQLIKLLNEQKAAIINQAVTKGLDPNVKMKDSGIEWLGEIPEHWEKHKLKYLISKPIAGAWGAEPQNDDNDITCVRVADFSEYEIKTNNLTIRNIEAKTEQILKPGDLLLEKSGGGEKTPVGRVVLFNQSFKAVTSNFVSKFSPKIDLVSSEYLLYIFKLINSVRWNFRSLKQTTGIQNIDTYQYMDNWVFIPKIEEQKIIVNHIKSEFKILDETITKIEKEIALVEEYKTALIAEAVTGKIDVRGYEVPEVTEEETYEEIEDPDSYRDSMAAEDAAEYENESDL